MQIRLTVPAKKAAVAMPRKELRIPQFVSVNVLLRLTMMRDQASKTDMIPHPREQKPFQSQAMKNTKLSRARKGRRQKSPARLLLCAS